MLGLNDWRERQSQWRRFAQWEARLVRDRPPDLAHAVAWFASAAELAARSDPQWASLDRFQEHVSHLVRIRTALAMLRAK